MPDPTYDLASGDADILAISQVRLLISDIPALPDMTAVFDDPEILAFLAMRDGNVKLAAATALRSLGSNAVQVRGRLTMLDARTDAPAEARALSEIADQLEREVDEAGVIGFV